MGRVCALLAGAILPIVVALVPGGQVAAQPPDAPSLKIGLPESMFSGLPAAVVAPAARPFQTMFEKQTGVKGEVVIAKDYQQLCDHLRGKKLDVAVFHGFEFAWVKQHPDLVPLLITVPRNKLQACLVVNAKSKAIEAKDLKGDCIAVPAATKAHCRVYLDTLKCKLPAGCCGIAKADGKSLEEVLDGIAAGSCEAALVDSATFAAYQRNKPGVGVQLKVLSESDPFPPAVIVYRKDAFNAQTAKKIRDGLIAGVKTPQGQLLTSLWRLKGFEEVTPPYRTDLEKCLKTYPAPKK